jgi:hypothetical protein
MIEIIFDIFEWYQQFMGVPEGMTYALFGGKKKRKAKRMMKELENKGIPEFEAAGFDSSEIPSFNTDNNPTRRETLSSNKAPEGLSYKPEFPYRGKQIIIDSDRVILNGKKDSAFIIADKAVGISTNGTFNVDSGGKTIINSPQIDLGLEASHPSVKGDILVAVLQQFLIVITTQVAPQLQAATDSNNVDIATVNRAGDALLASAVALNEILIDTLSEKVKIQ